MRSYPSRDAELTLTPSSHSIDLWDLYDASTERAILTIAVSYLGATRNFTATGKYPSNCSAPVINVSDKTISIELDLDGGTLITGDVIETITVTLDGNADYDQTTATFTWNPGARIASDYRNF